MPKPKRGEVWLVRFLFTNLSSTKFRPALVVAVHGEDAIVVGVFSRVPTGAMKETWVLVDETYPHFSMTGLKKSSVIKAEKIAVVHEPVLQRRLGRLPSDLMQQVQTALKRALSLTYKTGRGARRARSMEQRAEGSKSVTGALLQRREVSAGCFGTGWANGA